MRCDEVRQDLSLLVDGALDAGAAPALFAHLERCTECRRFLDGAFAARAAMRRDRELATRVADTLLPARLPGSDVRRPARARAPWAGSPVRAGVVLGLGAAFAALLLVAGIAIGIRLPRQDGATFAPRPAAEPGAPPPAGPQVVYVCAMPEYQVLGKPIAADAPPHDSHPETRR